MENHVIDRKVVHEVINAYIQLKICENSLMNIKHRFNKSTISMDEAIFVLKNLVSVEPGQVQIFDDFNLIDEQFISNYIDVVHRIRELDASLGRLNSSFEKFNVVRYLVQSSNI